MSNPKVTARFNDVIRRSTIALPSNLNPTGLRCVTLRIPDDNEYEAALAGVVSLLQKWTTFQRDDNQSGAQVAQVWRDALASTEPLDDCLPIRYVVIEDEEEMSNIRLKPGNSCIIQMWCAPDQEFQDWLDISQCAASAAPGAVTQPSGDGTLAPDECKEYDVTLSGNNQWLLPVPVLDGYTITITAAGGGWNDGQGVSGWYCPNGQPYIFGGCAGLQGHAGGDPSATLYHAQLMIVVDGTYYDPFAGPVTLSGVSGTQALTLQMNDESLSDNAGSIQFHIEVCAGDTAIWCKEMDFTTSDFGWSGAFGDAAGVYTPGEGWNSVVVDGEGTYVCLGYDFSSTTTITSIELTYRADLPFVTNSSSYMNVGTSDTLGSSEIVASDAQPGGYTLSASGSWVADLIRVSLGLNRVVDTYTTANISKIKIRGTGTNPFGSDNC